MKTFVLAFSIFQAILCACPTGFELIEEDGECRGNYTRVTTPMNELQIYATSLCSGILGLPIIIHNEQQQNYWMNRLDRNQWVVIGLICNASTSRWEWVDGSDLDYKPPADKYQPLLDQACASGYSWVMRSDGWWSYDRGGSSITSDVFCTTPLRQPLPSPDGCDNFEDDSDDGVCYQIGATAENWKEAQLICGSFGADVASIHNAQENSFVRRLAVSKGALGGVYLGATLSGKGNDFTWTDGSDWDYDNFYPGFPMSGLGDCIILDSGVTSGDWANVDCSSKLSVACVRKQNYVAPACSVGPWKEGQIMYSPGFPFDASTPCDFILSVDVGMKIELEVLFLEANPCCDNLIIFENYFGANIIANLTGEISDKKYATSASNFMRVSWQPNGGVNVRGMMMTFRAV